jgi:FkbM family methyltransferase
MFSNNDDLIAMSFYWFGPSMYEPMSMQVWLDRCKSAQVIYDVGAFSGVYSLSAAVQNPKSAIVAFEAVRRTYARLLLNIQTNQLTKAIQPVNLAVSDKEDIVTFYQYRAENILGNGASMMVKNIPVTNSDEKVNTVSLDGFIGQGNPVPDLIKIDVEGAEEMVVNGMGDLLSEHKPQLLIEVTPQNAKTVDTLLRGRGYKVYAIDEEAMALTVFDGACKKVTNLLAE